MRPSASLSQMLSCCRCAVCLLLLGCRPTGPTNEAQPGTSAAEKTSLRVLVIDDSDLAGVIRQQWQTRSIDDELEVRTASREELQSARRLSADVVVFPSPWMGELVERELIQPIPETMLQPAGENPPLLKLDDLLPTVRQCDVSWGRKVYAVTLGSPQMVLLYRPDLFEKLQLSPPATWAEYQAAVVKLADRKALGELAPAADKPWHAALESTAAGWAGVTLLARAASAVRSEGQMYAIFDPDQMSARIASPPFVAAAREMAAALQTSEAADRKLSPEDVRKAFFAGECGMAITWPSAAGDGDMESKVQVAFAELPGRAEAFSYKTSEWVKKAAGVNTRTSLCGVSGRLAAVTREARRSRYAFQLLAWLSSSETAQAMGRTSPHTTLFRRPQLSNPAPWLGDGVSGEAGAQYAQVVESSFSRAGWMPIVRLPGVDAYQAALDAAVWKAISDPDQSSEALTTAAQEWDGITKSRNLSQQRRAYQRSLGNDF